VVDAPPGQGLHVKLVELAEAVVGEGQRRAQLACAERRDRSLARGDECLNALEAYGQRLRLSEDDALDLEPRLSRHTSRILKDCGYEAIAAGLEDCSGHSADP